MSESGKRKRRSRKTKEQKLLEKIAKEQQEKEQALEEKKEQEKQAQEEGMNPQDLMKEYERIESIISTDQDVFQKMMDMDVRIKYSFIKTLHNNLTSINSRFNWKPEELMAIGSIFRDFQNIELNV